MPLRKSFLVLLIVLVLTACTAAPALPTALQTSTAAPAPTTIKTVEPAAEIPTATASSETVSTPTTASGKTILVVLPAETTVSYAVEETFLNENNKIVTAIGSTSQVTGSLTFDPSQPTQMEFGQFTVDISTLKSDKDRRDNAIRTKWLESSTYPLAKFDVTSLEGFPESPQEGQSISFKMIGDLTVRETTLPVTWDVTAVYQDGKLTGQATTFLMMADYGVPPPDILGILIVKDGVTLTLDFTFAKQ